ncbi:proline racemase family protein [Lysinibacillus xylanilyticus]|uniref:proline racemase family protein n=1 Tax=Lysinibacillus xylanilyticus TaxID=582475 RepID=UPI003D01865A
MMEKKNFVKGNYDYLRKLLMNEPRGHKDLFGSILVEPINKQCDSGSYLNMCGRGIIGTVTMCINTGLIEKKDKVLVDTPSGIVECSIYYNGDEVEAVEFKNVPAFACHKDLKIELNELGTVQLDIAFRGSFFAIVNASELKIVVDLQNKQEILKYAKI